MTAEQFAYWLQGYAELNDAPPTVEQWKAIREHLSLVFNKVTTHRFPARDLPNPYLVPQELRPDRGIDVTRITCSGTVLASGDGETRFAR